MIDHNAVSSHDNDNDNDNDNISLDHDEETSHDSRCQGWGSHEPKIMGGPEPAQGGDEGGPEHNQPSKLVINLEDS